MKILIAADMEGVTGVVHWDQVDPSHREYAHFRRLMHGDVNAAVRGAFDGGADSVVVTDGHGDGRNLLRGELDARAELYSGSLSPLSMVSGADAGVEGALFIGYHARVGSENAILDHTWSGSRISNIWLNGELIGETGTNAALCGHFGVPLLMVSGDQALCAEAEALIPGIETAMVKEAVGRMSARCPSPEVTAELIYERARRAVSRLAAGEAPAPYRIPPASVLTVEFTSSQMADGAATLPGAWRDERRVNIAGPDMLNLFGFFRALLALARD